MNKFQATASAVLLGGALSGMTTPQPAEAQPDYEICQFSKADPTEEVAYFKKAEGTKCTDYGTQYDNGITLVDINGSDILSPNCETFTRLRGLDKDSNDHEGVDNICEHMNAPKKFFTDAWYTIDELEAARPEL